MKNTTSENLASQERRLAAKTQDQRMINEIVGGTGMSPWEAIVIVDVIRDVYFDTPGNAPLRHGQMLYTCVKTEAGAGVPLKECPMASVVLTPIDPDDNQISGAENIRRHRIGRLCEEAREQGGLLTQEDLALLLFCDARTIRRDIRKLKEQDIHIPTRGQQKDIGPTLTHKGVAIRHWLEGKEPQEVARTINHSLRAVERYLNHFARIIYCLGHGFCRIQTAFAIGISSATVNAYVGIYEEYKHKEGFKMRFKELECIGAAHYESGDAKKGALLANEKLSDSSQKGARTA